MFCRGLALHMDGARFANAVVALNASPADLTWRAGVDVLSFGATKNGALAAKHRRRRLIAESRGVAFFVFVLLPVPVDAEDGPLLRFPDQQSRKNAVSKSIDSDVERSFCCSGVLRRSLQVIHFRPLQILGRREMLHSVVVARGGGIDQRCGKPFLPKSGQSDMVLFEVLISPGSKRQRDCRTGQS